MYIHHLTIIPIIPTTPRTSDAETLATQAHKKQKTTVHNSPKPTGLNSTSTMMMTTPDAIIMVHIISTNDIYMTYLLYNPSLYSSSS